MRRLTFSVLIAMFTFVLGVAAAAWSLHYFNRDVRIDRQADTAPKRVSQTEESITSEWKKINLDGKVSFYVPADVKQGVLETASLYRTFRRDGMDITMLYGRIRSTAVCVNHSEEKLSRHNVSRTEVAGRDATLLNVENALFGPEDLENTRALNGLTICVPSVGDGEHELVILARHKNEKDYQDVRRIIDSIKFP